MKKVILTLSIILSIGSLANAGYCRLGKASLIPLDKDKKIYELSCDDQDIICYETDPGGNTHPGSKIIVHFGEIKLECTIMSAPPSNITPATPQGVPTNLLPAQLIVKDIK